MGAFEDAVRTVRFLSVDAVEKARSGHPGTPMALAGVAVEIFTRHLRFVPERPDWANRDRFVLSCGHASMLLYSLLHLAGYDVTLDDLKSFRQWGSKTPGHPEVGHTAGVETTTGPLGQGVGNAVGLALASKMAAARVNEPGSTVVDYRVFALASDGDLMEGVASEASSIAGHLGLDNLVLVYDDNKITIDGTTDLAFSEDVGRRYESYGWFVQHVDGHDEARVRAALDRAVEEHARPSLVVARTHIAIGAPTKQDTSAAHGSPLGADEIAGAKKAAGWPADPFHIAEDARKPFVEAARRNRESYEAWATTIGGLRGDRAERWRALSERAVPENVFDELLSGVGDEAAATRASASKIQQRAAALVPSLVGGSADLAASCKTDILEGGSIGKREFAGRNLHFGIREHAMGAICNGLALSGLFIPFGSTFLIFSDYMRPAVRLAALMRQRAVFVYTHDSVYLGEDGPTHQPVEHLWALRLIPNLDVFRPADEAECAAAWAHAVSRRDGPTAMALSRQKVPPLKRPAGFDPLEMTKGAYVLVEPDGGRDPEVTLIASGSETHVAIEVCDILRSKGKAVRVVSAPCLEVFERRPAEDRKRVLGGGLRVSLEAGVTEPWRAFVGREGLAIGIDRFGASAPAARIQRELGLTAEQVAERVLAAL